MSDGRETTSKQFTAHGSGLQELPLDVPLVLVYALVVGAVALEQPFGVGTPVRTAMAVPFLLFLPGYALLSVVFPGRPVTDADRLDPFDARTTIARRGITGMERAALAFGLSLAIVPILALALSASGSPLTTRTMVATTDAFVVASVSLGGVRRLQRPADERFTVPFGDWLQAGYRSVFETGSVVDSLLNVAVALSVLVAVSSIAFAIAVPQDASGSTNFYLVTENESGAFVAADYPNNLARGDPGTLHVGVENHEGRDVQYTVVAQLQRVETDGNDVTVLERRELGEYVLPVSANDTRTFEHTFRPQTTGENLRLTYLLYRGDTPESPTIGNAYRHTYVWVNVSQ
ncbi:DUF1616 domain-containing protein [Halobacteriaceae archaeon GCM10025711]